MGYGMTYSSPNGSPGQERREKPNDWLGPKNGSGDSFPSAEIDNKKVSCWTGFVADGTKAKYFRVKEDEKYLLASTKRIR